MLDNHSLDVISRFKQAVLAKKVPSLTAERLHPNRGIKADMPASSLDLLQTKVAEYDGVNHLILTNESIEKSNYRNKRKWKEFYGTSDSEDSDENDNDHDDDDDEDASSDSDDEHPFKKIKIADILAPLGHPLEVVSHPAILKTYKLPIFHKIASEFIDIIEVEQKNLNWLNKLLQVLNGEDWFYLLEENLGLQKYDHGLDEDKGVAPADAVKPEDADGVTDPFFALPETLKRYEAHQLQQESNDELATLHDELVNYLQVSIQRQHEYIKNLTYLRNGIVRADRLKKDLYKWGKEMYDRKSS
ncbi:uncharacterized protein CANTADRAFT_45777 [Suhomyces tanzawaensis NRRL Y-17324]|uniref:Transcriptional regulatory protein RXT2 N-terminal domain-containing protein n=1 Tax=Suhomyces tanzawaensis NRRL Y-17324 TaxID=984487 RepID=A0A1E4SQA9_9ASCO|nr:uncharacterized protein CANTADRAFT_45777 [Suhomyces tanzawaensis NRRL Y-17324]ODV81700.1 hypothetical protein CANTADRAFT_45777 [Suhomyces tanzawaensis NRRL Y-17324]